MKEKILQLLKASIVGSDGKTSVSEKTLGVYVDLICEKITEESQIAEGIKPYVSVLKELQGNINHVAASAVSAKEALLKAEHEKELKNLKESQTGSKTTDDFEAKINEFLGKHVEPLKKELEAYRVREAGEKRSAMIISKAKELGISQLRIDEGFAIAADSDESGITAYLSKIAKNEVSRNLESENGLFMKATQIDAMKTDAKAWADTIAPKQTTN